MDLTSYIEHWVRERAAALRLDGIVAAVGRGGEAGPKSMAFCNLETSNWIGELLLWTTGEVELGATRTADGEEINEHHRVGSQEELAALLERLRCVVKSAQP